MALCHINYSNQDESHAKDQTRKSIENDTKFETKRTRSQSIRHRCRHSFVDSDPKQELPMFGQTWSVSTGAVSHDRPAPRSSGALCVEQEPTRPLSLACTVNLRQKHCKFIVLSPIVQTFSSGRRRQRTCGRLVNITVAVMHLSLGTEPCSFRTEGDPFKDALLELVGSAFGALASNSLDKGADE